MGTAKVSQGTAKMGTPQGQEGQSGKHKVLCNTHALGKCFVGLTLGEFWSTPICLVFFPLLLALLPYSLIYIFNCLTGEQLNYNVVLITAV